MRRKILLALSTLLILSSLQITNVSASNIALNSGEATTGSSTVNISIGLNPGSNSSVATNASTASSVTNLQKNNNLLTVEPSVDEKTAKKPAKVPPRTKRLVKRAGTMIPVLMYHHLSYEPAKGNTSITSPDKFKAEMELLKKEGYTTIFFADFFEHMEKDIPLPEKPIIVTFDDGYYSNYQYAYPILKELGMKATISIVGWSVGRDHTLDEKTKITKHFTWEQAKEMYDNGVIDIQHHTFDLHSVTKGIKGVAKSPGETQFEYEKRFKADTIKLKELIESKIGNQVYVYCYPYGVHNDTTEKILKELGFKATLTITKGVTDFDGGQYKIKPFNMSPLVKSEKIFSDIKRAVTYY